MNVMRYTVVTEGSEARCLLRTDDHRQALQTARLYAGVSTVRIMDRYEELLGPLGAKVRQMMAHGKSTERIVEMLAAAGGMK